MRVDLKKIAPECLRFARYYAKSFTRMNSFSSFIPHGVL